MRTAVTATLIFALASAAWHVLAPQATAQSAPLGMSSDLDRVRKLLGFHVCYVWEPYLLGK